MADTQYQSKVEQLCRKRVCKWFASQNTRAMVWKIGFDMHTAEGLSDELIAWMYNSNIPTNIVSKSECSANVDLYSA